MPKEKLTLEGVMDKLQLIEHNRAKDEGERLHNSILLIHQYLSIQPDREKAYHELKEEVQKHKELDYVFAHI